MREGAGRMIESLPRHVLKASTRPDSSREADKTNRPRERSASRPAWKIGGSSVEQLLSYRGICTAPGIGGPHACSWWREALPPWDLSRTLLGEVMWRVTGAGGPCLSVGA